ncbi:MAG: multicopper oxidase domain-containing protein, partial [Bacteroidota bacterium]|nr:multicopper oxidase domain-containing protein [Bacteroidota bacterium]
MKYVMLLFMLFSAFQLKAQHDMKDMPGMKMPMEKKAVKKPAAKKSGISQSEKVIYTCVMHPQIQKDKPGNCPICGMKLVKKTIKVVPTKSTPKHDDMNMPMNDTTKKMDMNMNMDKDKDKDMKMDNMQGMDMSKKENVTQSQPISYTCPMHPQIHSPKPGNCPICGMKLVKEKPKAIAHPNHDNMQMPARPSGGDKGKPMDMGNMKMDKDKSMDKSMDMGDMKMDKMDKADMDMAKANLGTIKTIASKFPPRTVRYDLYVRDTMVTFGKKPKHAIAVNGQIPMPTLTFTEGDTALIYVHNELNEVTALHWHGLFLPNRMDGVPFLTQMPIKPHTTYTYKFPIVQHGTHWYHSHSKLEEQIGMYGAFIMNKRNEWDIPTIPVVISEWTDMKPEEVHRSLKSATDWFAIQKGTTQSYAEAIKTGHFKTKLTNEWKRMN